MTYPCKVQYLVIMNSQLFHTYVHRIKYTYIFSRTAEICVYSLHIFRSLRIYV